MIWSGALHLYCRLNDPLSGIKSHSSAQQVTLRYYSITFVHLLQLHLFLTAGYLLSMLHLIIWTTSFVQQLLIGEKPLQKKIVTGPILEPSKISLPCCLNPLSSDCVQMCQLAEEAECEELLLDEVNK